MNERGQTLLLAVIIIGLVLVNTLMIIAGSQLFLQNSAYNMASSQAMNLAEAGVDKAIASLNSSGGTYIGETETILGAGSFSVSITTPSPNIKVVEAIGYVPNKASPKAKKTIQATVSKGIGLAFNYGVQVGDGGLEMSQNSTVNGSVYSNGNIIMANNARISGDAYVAGGTQSVADQESDCSGGGCADFLFGKNIGGNNQLDVAQSFKPTTGSYLTKVAVKLKKTGSPPDLTMRILKDIGGRPDKNNVLSSGTLSASLVTTGYGFVEVALLSPPLLTAEESYWIMLDTSANSNNSWSWSADLLQGYTRGSALWSPNWQAGSPEWNAPSPAVDLGFKVYLGGLPTYIQGSNGATISGDAYANTLQNLIINGTKGAYYQVEQSLIVGGSSCNNNSKCHPGSIDPPTQVMPVSDANIQTWQNQAQNSGIYTGNISTCQSQLGPGKYVGNVTLTNNCTVTITHPVWITGNLVADNGVILKLDPAVGYSSGVIVVDGQIILANGSKIQGSGTAGSFLMALSTFDSQTTTLRAVEVQNIGNTGVLYAPKGLIYIANSNQLNEVTAWKVQLNNNVTVDYDTGLASIFFSSGPSGSYSLVKGMYQLKK